MNAINRFAAATCILGIAGGAWGQFDFCSLSNEGPATAEVVLMDQEGNACLVFTNTSVEGPGLTNVYIEDTKGLLSNVSVNAGEGVEFEEGGTPPNLPGGQNLKPPFEATFAFGATSPENALDAGETLSVCLEIEGLADIDAIQAAIDAGDIRIGFKQAGPPDAGSYFLRTCPADLNCDGTADFFDYLAFNSAFNAGKDEADFDQSGTHDLFDFLAFVNAFNACQ